MRTRDFSKDCFFRALVSLCADYSYEEIQISQICKEAGFNRSTFYRAYKTKDDILRQRADALLQQYREHCLKEKYNDYQKSRYLFSFYREHSEMLLLMYRAHLFDELRKMGVENFPENTEKEYGDYEKTFLINGYLGVLVRWIEGGMKESDDYMAQCVSSLCSMRKA